jgi:hypothetical protein
MNAKSIAAVILVTSSAALYQASTWWERAFATYESSVVSPDGCFRIDTYKPFWLLPSMFHQSPHPDPDLQTSFGRPWEAAVFRRAYEISTGDILGETVAFDPVGPAPLIFWSEPAPPGRRIVFANQFPLFDSDRCADAETMAKLEAFYGREREANRPIVEAWEKARSLETPSSVTSP